MRDDGIDRGTPGRCPHLHPAGGATSKSRGRFVGAGRVAPDMRSLTVLSTASVCSLSNVTKVQRLLDRDECSELATCSDPYRAPHTSPSLAQTSLVCIARYPFQIRMTWIAFAAADRQSGLVTLFPKEHLRRSNSTRQPG